MKKKIEAGDEWMCLIKNTSGITQKLVKDWPNPIDLTDASFAQLIHGESAVTMYFDDQKININTYHWPDSFKPESQFGMVSKIKTGLSEDSAKKFGIHKYALSGEPAMLEFGNPTSSDYLKIITG